MKRLENVEPIGLNDICTVCNVEQDISNFIKSSTNKRGYVRECRPCRRSRNNSCKYSTSHTKGQINRGLVRAFKDRPCVDCKNSYPHYVMDLDHVRGQKQFILSQCYSQSTEDVIEELKKCDVVCANCHRERTFNKG